MKRPKGPPARAQPAPVRLRDGSPDSAFDLWLQRGLHQLFDDVAKEPIPEELLRLIEQAKRD